MDKFPLRWTLRYDPVFLELGKRLADEDFGAPSGVTVSSAVSSLGDLSEVLAFLFDFFGRPTFSNCSYDKASRLFRGIFLFGSIAMSFDAVVLGGSLPASFRATITGSVSCAKALLEFRFGSERLLSFSKEEDKSITIQLPEGDGEYYRRADIGIPDSGRRILRDGDDGLAVSFARNLLSGAVPEYRGEVPS